MLFIETGQENVAIKEKGLSHKLLISEDFWVHKSNFFHIFFSSNSQKLIQLFHQVCKKSPYQISYKLKSIIKAPENPL